MIITSITLTLQLGLKIFLSLLLTKCGQYDILSVKMTMRWKDGVQKGEIVRIADAKRRGRKIESQSLDYCDVGDWGGDAAL